MISISKNLIRNARAESAASSPSGSDGGEEARNGSPPEAGDVLGSSPPDEAAAAPAAAAAAAAAAASKQARQKRPARRGGGGGGGTSFAKEPVAPARASGGVASGLSRGLEQSGSRQGAFEAVRQRGAQAGGPTTRLDVFVTPGAPPLRLKIQGATPVDDVIAIVIRRHTEQGRRPSLLPDPDAYELRMVDDDEGTPDTDMPPLERGRFVHEFNVEEVALCALPGGGGGGGGGAGGGDGEVSQLRHRTRSSRGVSLDLNVSMRGKMASGVFFVKVRLSANQAYTFRVREDQLLGELLAMVAKKRGAGADELSAEMYKFRYPDDVETPLDMEMAVGDLESEEVCLVRRDEAAELLVSIPEAGAAAAEAEHKFTFTLETAREYERFAVVKTNQRGRRQDRVMAIEGDRIHNIDPTARKDVHRPHRLMTDVRSIERLDSNPRAFRISFIGNNDVREYEAETKLECARIVAKVDFLVRHLNRGAA